MQILNVYDFSDLLRTNHWDFFIPHRKMEPHETRVIFPRADFNCLHNDLSLTLRFIMSGDKLIALVLHHLGQQVCQVKALRRSNFCKVKV